MRRVVMLLLAEIDVPAELDELEEQAFCILDDFREAVRPSFEYGITLSRATSADVKKFVSLASAQEYPPTFIE